jgi:nucleoside-diphosphate-sugar epimerase
MKVLLTGGSGDLGQALVPMLLRKGHTPLILDVRAPRDSEQQAVFIQGSILDRTKLKESFDGCDCIVHIAAWHGIHESRGVKNSYDFFDLNVRGTFEVFEAAVSHGINKIVFISTTSVDKPDTLYGRSKILSECIADNYRKYSNMNVITLRPRAFIPFWNHDVYANYSEWARWFWKGAVHIDDVTSAVMLSLDLISRRRIRRSFRNFPGAWRSRSTSLRKIRDSWICKETSFQSSNVPCQASRSERGCEAHERRYGSTARCL